MREIIHLACEKCKRRNYHTTKNKKTHTEKFQIRKYCKFCRQHTIHKEAKL
ncbi:50S ribosomal protein L33 [Nitrosophilus kaiyonis]|uniref:50S ribosomal protein L33 n=1 Tax=Nitrosophilus kaiyonis TaxID=2930200 RepID=UPI0024906C59|nr:50S ribosomal protein L33 [Nitrosophilus kaiyonis]